MKLYDNCRIAPRFIDQLSQLQLDNCVLKQYRGKRMVMDVLPRLPEKLTSFMDQLRSLIRS